MAKVSIYYHVTISHYRYELIIMVIKCYNAELIRLRQSLAPFPDVDRNKLHPTFDSSELDISSSSSESLFCPDCSAIIRCISSLSSTNCPACPPICPICPAFSWVITGISSDCDTMISGALFSDPFGRGSRTSERFIFALIVQK